MENVTAVIYEPFYTSAVGPEEPKDSLVFQIVLIVFTVISVADFLLQAVVVVFVFATLIAKKCCEFLTIIILVVFVLVRVVVGYTLITSIPLNIVWIDDLAEIVPAEFLAIWFYFSLSSVILYASVLLSSCGLLLLRGNLSGAKMEKRGNDGVQDGQQNSNLPQVVILMPVYNEEPAALLRAVNSVVSCDYPQERKHLLISFDDINESPLYLTLVQSFVGNANNNHEKTKNPSALVVEPGWVKRDIVYPQRLDFTVERMLITVSRFPHGGKRSTQAKSYAIINEVYEKQADNTFVLFIDSDIILHKHAIHNFVSSGRSKEGMLGMTGLVTCITSREFNVLQCLQDAEYVEGQLFVRSSEVRLGAATCLPGALTLVDLRALQNIASVYFGELETVRTSDYHRFHLGEDRYLTFLLMGMSKEFDQVGFECSAQCKTDAPAGFFQLLKQRRRWFLGGILNDLAMISSTKIWFKFPLLNAMKLFEYSTRGLSFLTWIIIFAYNRAFARNTSANEQVIFFAIPLIIMGIKFLLTFVAAIQLNRMKVAVFTVLVSLLSPIFNGIVIVYSIWTWNIRSWGGPRTEAEEKTPRNDPPSGDTFPSLQVC